MRLLTANEVANILRVSKARVYDLARSKSIPVLLIGKRQVRFSENSIREWIASGGSVKSIAQGGTN